MKLMTLSNYNPASNEIIAKHKIYSPRDTYDDNGFFMKIFIIIIVIDDENNEAIE